MPKTSTVLVDSEKGSRLSLPSTVRAPFTVTGSSRATGCGREAVSSGRNEVDAGAAEEVEGIAVKTSLSFVIGAINDSLNAGKFVRPSRTQGSPRMHICCCWAGHRNHSTSVPRLKHLSQRTAVNEEQPV